MKENLNENERQIPMGPYTHGKDIKLKLTQSDIEQWVYKARKQLIHLADKKILMSIDTNGMQIQSAFYAIEDSQSVIEGYKKLSDSSLNQFAYLNLYGLLQGLFVQQDAFRTLFKSCIDDKFSLNSAPDLMEIREIRNNTIGHPTNDGNEYYLVYQHSLNKYGYTLLGHLKDGSIKTKNVSIYELLQKQENGIKKLMKTFIDQLSLLLNSNK